MRERERARKEGDGSPANMGRFINIIFASPIVYDMKCIYKFKTYMCITFNERNSKKRCIATRLRNNKK